MHMLPMICKIFNNSEEVILRREKLQTSLWGYGYGEWDESGKGDWNTMKAKDDTTFKDVFTTTYLLFYWFVTKCHSVYFIKLAMHIKVGKRVRCHHVKGGLNGKKTKSKAKVEAS